MKALRFALLALLRDWRSGELAVLLAALVVAVTALTGVGFFTDRIGQAVDQRAAEVLAADLRLRGTDPVSTDYDALAAERGICDRAHDQLPERRVLRRGLGAHRDPRGRPRLSAARQAQDRRTRRSRRRGRRTSSRRTARPGSTHACSRGSARGVGDRVNIGAAVFTVTRVLDYRPDQGSAFTDLAPTLLIPIDDLPATELLGPGSRATYSLLFAGKPADIRAFRSEIARAQDEGRAAGRGRGGEPADPVLDAPRGPLPEPVRDDHGAARGDRGRHGGAALHAAPPRQRRAHEVHGRAAAPRVAGDGDRARADRADRRRSSARRSATSRRSC